MPSSAKPTTTTWYVVIKCFNTVEDSFLEVSLLTTDHDEAVEKEREITDSLTYVGIVWQMEVYNS